MTRDERVGRGRQLVLADRGMISSGHYLASLTGLHVLEGGGNAVDAAVAASATLAVVRPHMCGIGGDAFMLLYDAKSQSVQALNGSGRAPAKATLQYFQAKHLTEIPQRGILSATVPGLVDLWFEALTRYGTRDFVELAQDGIQYAEHGYPAYQRLCRSLGGAAFRDMGARERLLREVFWTKGQPPTLGDRIANPRLAASLRTIAKEGRDAFYRGTITRALVRASEARGGLFSEQDFAEHQSTWTNPIQSNLRGYHIITFPPNTQGVGLLQQLNLLQTFDLAACDPGSADYLHLLIEAKKVVFDDVVRCVADPEFMQVPVEHLLSEGHARELHGRLERATGGLAAPRKAETGGDTTYLCVVDRDGNCVSLILSLYEFFGSGVFLDDTGVILHNRARGFSLDPAHPNRLEPHKRPFHTLCPAMILADGAPYLVYGTPGASGQTQTLVQITNNLLVYGMDLQAAIEAPRFRHVHGAESSIEFGFDDAVYPELQRRGHQLTIVPHWDNDCGGVEAILVDRARGVLAGGADPRRDGVALGF